MYFFHEDFKIYGDNKQPYGVYIEECSSFYHKHTRRTERGYSLSCSGNKYLWATPPLHNFRETLRFSYQYPTDEAAFTLLFRYDRRRHRGPGLNIGFSDDGTLILRLCVFDGIDRHVAEEKRYSGDLCGGHVAYPVNGAAYTAELVLQDNRIGGRINDIDFSFVLPEEWPDACGEAGMMRSDFIGELILEDVAVQSDDEMDQAAILSPVTVEIPLYSGGNMPYVLSWSAERIGGTPFFTFTFDGGVQYREKYHAYPLKTGQYTVEIDRIRNPYVRLGKNKYYLYNGSLNTADPGLHWKDVLTEWFAITRLPISKTVALSAFNPSDTLSFGYESMEADGYLMQSEGAWEFVFDQNGVFLETRSPEEIDFCKVVSLKNDVFKLISDHCVRKNEVIEHFAGNHYFSENEPIIFQLRLITKKDPHFVVFDCKLLDVYGCPLEDGTSDLTAEQTADQEWEVRHAPLPVACYRIVIHVLYGTIEIANRDVVFEVFDKLGQRCAPLESGLPFLFSTPNEQRYLDRDPFDPWSPYASCNMEHYYSCVSFTGYVAEERRTWEMTEPLARKWYVWLSDHRTMEEHDLDRHADIVRHADYMYFPIDCEWAVLRHDYWKIDSYRFGMDKIVARFLDERPDIREQVGFHDGEAFTRQHLERLLKCAMNEWHAWANRYFLECFRRQNRYFTERNPKFKRASYGPYSVYGIPMHTNHFIDHFGFPQGRPLAEDVFTGFCQFEDYPCSCAYQTYRGAFSAATILLHNPGLAIYPEQYTTSEGGCLDGLVKFAAPPLGAYKVPLWFNTTHAREYVYNTAYRDAEGYHYLDQYGFMQRDLKPQDLEYFVRHWKTVLDHKPERPLRTTCFVAECDPADDRVEDWAKDKIGYQHIFNVSDSGLGFIYEVSRMCGLPCGFMANWDAVTTLTADDCDLIVLPSTASAPPEAIAQIRRLYKAGVSLFAVSSVDGLEDIFKVKPARRTVPVSTITDKNGGIEYILPLEAEFNYTTDCGEVPIYAGKEPVLIKNGRAVLLNAAPSYIGRNYNLELSHLGGFESTSRLLRNVCAGILRQISSPLAWTDTAHGETCTGLSLFRDKQGREILLSIDYSDHDPDSVDNRITETTVFFGRNNWHAIKCCENTDTEQASPLIENGVLRGVMFRLRMHESCIIELV
ncbi:MAG: hypothetical protein VB070_05870 [Clostridiaceae bacterium]|nr:hypothetical protein [Clostridiaceae bacterium]